MPFPWLAAAGASAGLNILSNLFAPSKSEFTASNLRSLLTQTRRHAAQGIQSGVDSANRAAAAQAAQAGITSPGYMARISGLNEMAGAQQMSALDAQLSQQEIGGRQNIAAMNLQAGQQKAQGIGAAFGSLADPLAQMATLQYLLNNPELLSSIRGEV